ncbi:hypothetical protein BJV77DRAFT_959567 [Russula vinacea]|nr:hypothetical protein BJV77DRAFT_959567 [Russula vinacea]
MNWFFTVSDKRNTSPARLSLLPTTPRRSTLPENTPLPIPAFLHPAFVPIVTGGATPMQTGCPGPHTPVIDKDDDLAAAPLYLPMRQQDVIHAFLDHVRVICDDVHECTLCLERYHGMTLHDTLCARSHNEVPFLLVRALTDILMSTFHKTANIAANHADTGEITPELHDIIDSITQMEEMLRSHLPLLRRASNQKWEMLSLPLPWTPDALTYVDNTDSGSLEHFFPTPGFRTTKTSRHSGKRGRVERRG